MIYTGHAFIAERVTSFNIFALFSGGAAAAVGSRPGPQGSEAPGPEARRR